MFERIGAYFAGAFGRVVAYLPNLISALAIAIVGYFLSRLAGSLTRRALKRLHFDNFVARHLRRPGAGTHPDSASSAVGSAVFWLGILVTASQVARSLELPTLSAGIDRILAFLPNVLVAVIIVAVAGAVSRAVARLIGDVGGGVLAKAAQVAIMAVAVFMALDQVGIARNIVTTTFIALLGAVAVAAAIAFGVGNIGLARQATERWSRRARGTLDEREERVRPIETPVVTRAPEPAPTKH